MKDLKNIKKLNYKKADHMIFRGNLNNLQNFVIKALADLWHQRFSAAKQSRYKPKSRNWKSLYSR